MCEKVINQPAARISRLVNGRGMGHTSLMRLLRRAWLGYLILGLTLVGCTNANRTQVASVKRVYLENTKLNTNSTIEMITPGAFESATIELTRHGYVVVSSKNLSEGVLRISWQTNEFGSKTPGDCPMSLSMTLFNKKGKRIYSGSSGPALPASFWTQSRTSAEVASILAAMPYAVTAAQ